MRERAFQRKELAVGQERKNLERTKKKRVTDKSKMWLRIRQKK